MAPWLGRQHRRGSTGRGFNMLTAAVETSGEGSVEASSEGGDTTRWGDAGAGGLGMGLGLGAGRSGEAAEETALEDLTKMKLAELKQLYRDGGGKPGTLRKAELVERLTRSLGAGQVHTGARPETIVVPPEVTADEPPTTPTQHRVEAAAASTAGHTSVYRPGSASPEGGGVVDGDLLARGVVNGGAEGVVVVDDGQHGHEALLSSSLEGDKDSEGTATAPTGSLLNGRDVACDTAALDMVVHAMGDTRGSEGIATPAAAAAASTSSSRFTPDQARAGAIDSVPLGEEGGGNGSAAGRVSGGNDVVGDVLASGPSAVVAAARARGAAAAAASARVAAESRARAMVEARRHTEAVRSRAANGWLQSPEGLRQQPEQQQKRGNGILPTVGALTGVSGRQGGEGDEAASTATTAAAAAAAATSTADRGLKMQGVENGNVARQPDGMLNSAGAGGRSAGTGRREGARRTADYARGGGIRTRGVDRPGGRGGGGRPRLLPKMPNPWSRAGAGGAAEGLPEEEDVVDEFLAEKMQEASDKEPDALSVDSVFYR